LWLGKAAEATPSSAVAEHNLAGALGDAQRSADSEAAARRAFSKGLDAPETWLVLARALSAQDRVEEARAAYGEALARRPGYADALGDLAKLAWTETADADVAVRELDAALAANPGDPSLYLHKAKVLEYAGDAAGAGETLDRALAISQDPLLHVAIAQLAVRTDPMRALEAAQRAFAQRPDNYAVLSTLCQAQLALGRADDAERLALVLQDRQPLDQYALALLATAWRLKGDARYAELYDYDRVVGAFTLDTPKGWTTLAAYLADLAQALEPLHPFAAHPVGQSVRGGSQTRGDLATAEAPAIQAFFEAVDGPIRRYIAGLGRGDHPLRRRIGRGYRFQGVWSVKLRSSGFHTDHIHHKGWISSACYIALPPAVETGHEGWLKFGEPGVPTAPPLGPERFEKPEPGKLVLFPSYMWHGVVPFGGDAPRLSMAFDLLPA
ncbi:MAG: tetratricopeptide repeat protein, partial [Caulobacteraceae bacterium]|nr:tetratricopeptide repeat protein [Caulobacteraceae bacterium]